jgi:hypothetical protein
MDTLLMLMTRPETGLHPDDILTLLRYVPVGLESMLWRNTVLEDWHTSPDSRIHDPDMFRANTHTTAIFHEHLWTAFADQLAAGVLMSRDAFDDSDVPILEQALYGGLEEAFDDERELPNGQTLGELGGAELIELQNHAANQVASLMEQAERVGVYNVLAFLAMKGRLGSRWHWSTPQWPLLVDNFLAIAGDPDHEWWQAEHHDYPEKLPEDVSNWAVFRKLLLNAPWQLSNEAAEFCVWTVGIEFTRPDVNAGRGN